MQKLKFENVVCFGEVLWDMLPSGAKPGGAPLNVAIHMIKHGIQPLLISKVGNDEDGKKLLGFLAGSGLSTAMIQTDTKLPTSKVLVHLDEQKNATYEICEPVAWDNIQPDEQNQTAARSAGLLVYGSLASRNTTTRETLFQLLENSGATRLLDVNLRPPYHQQTNIEILLHKSDIVKLNDDELKIISGWNGKTGTDEELMRWMAGYFQCIAICVTRGANGAMLFIENKIYQHPGFQVNAVDTVGAGDSFLAGLIAGLAKNIPPDEALELACATGALVASRHGAVPDYSPKDIGKIINSASA